MHKHTNKVLPVVLLALVLSALFLGSLIYKKSNNTNKDSTSIPKIDAEVFSEDERKLLIPPGPDASKQEVEEHSKLAAKLAVPGTQVEIKDCKSEPFVLQTKITSLVTFKNTGSYDISVSFDKTNTLDVDINKSVSSDKVFVHGPGLYGYLCKSENFTGLTGFVLVTP